MGNKNLELRMRATLYSLKREYGGRIDVYKQGATSADLETGERTAANTVTVIRRAVILPAKLARREFRSVSLISANKSLVEGGWISDITHVFIIDRRDARGLSLSLNDWVVFNQTRCSIEKIEDFPFETGWVIHAKALIGDAFTQVHQLSASHNVDLSEDTDASQS